MPEPNFPFALSDAELVHLDRIADRGHGQFHDPQYEGRFAWGPPLEKWAFDLGKRARAAYAGAQRKMIQTKLYTVDGGFVTEVQMPPFQIKPEAVVWGSRFFIWNANADRYIEGMAWYCTHEGESTDAVRAALKNIEADAREELRKPRTGGLRPEPWRENLSESKYQNTQHFPREPEIPADRSARVLANGQPVTDDHREINPATGQQKDYVVLTAEERAKGFVRPVRNAYIHVGKPPLIDDHSGMDSRYSEPDYSRFKYPIRGGVNPFEGGCLTRTQMNQAIAETYARDPEFYGGTFCVHCAKHLPLNQFIWEGTTERVGS